LLRDPIVSTAVKIDVWIHQLRCKRGCSWKTPIQGRFWWSPKNQIQNGTGPAMLRGRAEATESYQIGLRVVCSPVQERMRTEYNDDES